jgi:hypothetical protein
MTITAVLAIIFSPVVAVLISLWVQQRRETRQNQLSILTALIGSRHQPLSPEGVRALNMIDLVFHDNEKVRGIWHEYFDMLCNEGLNNPSGFQQRNKKNIELVTAMAAALGYGKAITHLDIDRIYSPVGFWERDRNVAEIHSELLRVLKATARVGVEPIRPTGEAPTNGVI